MRSRLSLRCGLGVVALTLVAGRAEAQPNPYRIVEGWAKLPPGRTWGSSSTVFPAPDGRNIWVAERCGENSCVGHDDIDPVMLFDSSGKLVRSFGKGMIVWPHGIFVDRQGNVWIADGRGDKARGNQVYKFSPEGKLLMSLGKPGTSEPRTGRDTFDGPTAVLVAPDGSIFVADGHLPGHNNRIMKFAADGTFIKEWGVFGKGNGQLQEPHALALDSKGRLFVGDRYNSRIQIFDQNGKHLDNWTQFGRPSGIFIDKNDMIYVADSESNTARNPGFKRGIRVGSARDGKVTAFIPDPEPKPDSSATSAAEGVAVDAAGNLYGAEVGPKRIVKYVKK